MQRANRCDEGGALWERGQIADRQAVLRGTILQVKSPAETGTIVEL